MASRRKRRTKAVGSAVDAFLEATAQESRLEGLDDAALFSLDKGLAKGKAARPGKRPRDEEGSRVKLFVPAVVEEKESSTRRTQATKAAKAAERRRLAREAEEAEAARAKHASRGRGRTGASFLGGRQAAEPVADLWADGTTAPAPVVQRGELPPDAGMVYSARYARGAANPAVPERERRRPRSVPASKALAAVAVPDAGLSYNPSFEDHQDAIGEAVAHERAYVAKRARREALWAKDPEYRRTLDVIPDYSDDEDEDAAPRPPMSANPPVVVARKTTAQRNKELRVRAEEAARARAAKAAELDRVAASHRALARRAREEEAERAARRAVRAAARAAKDAAAEPVLLKKGRPAEARRDVEVVLTSELPGTLRTLRPGSARHPVHERWRGLMLQDRVEVGARKQGKRRGRKKVVATGRKPGAGRDA